MRNTLMTGLLAALMVPASMAVAEDWVTYQNARFGTQIEVPSSLSSLPPPQNGDGLTWASADGLTELVVYAGFWNVRSDDFDDYREWFGQMMRDRGASVTYQAEDDGWFVYAGVFRGNVFYVRTNRSQRCPNIAHTFELAYPADQKADRDPWAGRLGSSLSESSSSAECP